MITPQLDALVESLRAEFAGESRGKVVARLLADYASTESDWRSFAFHAPKSYTRNLVERNEHFELLILCWDEGQESPIHDHEGQDCWMGVLDGDIEEVRYDTPAEGWRGPLEPRASATFERGQVAFIRDDIALHLVRGHGGAKAVSLHLYAAPIDACSIYCPETGEISRRTLAYHSKRGELVTVQD